MAFWRYDQSVYGLADILLLRGHQLLHLFYIIIITVISLVMDGKCPWGLVVFLRGNRNLSKQETCLFIASKLELGLAEIDSAGQIAASSNFVPQSSLTYFV